MSSREPVIVGVIGCGTISDTYLERAKLFDPITIKACADLDMAAAERKGTLHGVPAVTPDALLADSEIELVLNLTPPLAHAEVGRQVIAAGKHLYQEKPLAVSLADGRALVEAAGQAGLRVGCAPDTFLGGGHQLARRLLDDGAVGRPVAAAARFRTAGMEHWHPNPTFYFKHGGGPILDMGPYYVTALVNLLGPVERVAALSVRGAAERVITSQPRHGERIVVEVATHVDGLLAFASGAVASFTMSWDTVPARPASLTVYGAEGTMVLPDPNFFGGITEIRARSQEVTRHDPQDLAFAAPNRALRPGDGVADYRIIGVVEMALALRAGRPHRTSEALALHVLEVLAAAQTAADTGRYVAIESRCERPEPWDGAGLSQAPH
jgi:predicted dehydrogenase